MRKFLILIVVAVGLAGCNSKGPAGPKHNLPPETHLFLVIGDSLGQVDSAATTDTSYSRLVLHWYGDDPDGEVIGYQYRWSSPSSDTIWKFTAKVADTFYVPIRSQFDYFTFYVRAVDNDSLIDLTAAEMTFPIINSPPVVRFPFAFTQFYDTARFTSFNYMTFSWDGGDPDGDETLVGFDFFLGDSSMRVDDLDSVQWSHLDSLTTHYTFTDLQPGFYRFFLRCQDVAGAYSSIIYYPDTIRGVWQVKERTGNILYIDDAYYYSTADTIFSHVLDSLNDNGLIDGYSKLSFEEKTFFYAQDIDSTLMSFEIVLWNAGSRSRGKRHLNEASSALSSFLIGGGHLMLNMSYTRSDTITYSFLPIDSIYNDTIFRPQFFVPPANGDTVFPEPPDTTRIYPDTLVGSALSNSFAFRPGIPICLSGIENPQVLYVTRGDTVAVRFPAYHPDNRQPAKLVYFSFDVFDCNRNGNFSRMLANVLQYEFR